MSMKDRVLSLLFKGWAGSAFLILLTVLLLLLVGIVFVYSSADNMSSSFPGPYSLSQIKKVILGILTMLAICHHRGRNTNMYQHNNKAVARELHVPPRHFVNFHSHASNNRSSFCSIPWMDS